MEQQKKPLLGAHVSTLGGYINGIIKGEQIGAECIQIFGASPRSYGAPLPSEENVADFKRLFALSSLRALFLHGAYLVNLGSADTAILNRSVGNLTAHYKIANMLGAGGLIFHVGSSNGGNREESLARAAKGITEVLKNVKGESYLVMENSGSLEKIGGSIADLEWILKKVNDPRLKICIDTAHAFEAGLIESYAPANIKKFFDELDDAVGIKISLLCTRMIQKQNTTPSTINTKI